MAVQLLTLFPILALGALGCGAPPSITGTTVTWLELEGARMLVTTTRAAHGRADAGLPILIVLPWSHATPAEALAEVGYLEIEVAARIVAIEGFERDGAGFSWWRRTRAAPDDPDDDRELVSLMTERAARLARVVGAVRRQFASAAPPVVSGISQGGDLSLALGVGYPGLVAATLPIAARFPEAMWPAPAAGDAVLPPVDVFQGSADPVAALAPLQRTVTALHDRGYPVVLHAYAGVAHEVSPAQGADIRACAARRLRGDRMPCTRR